MICCVRVFFFSGVVWRVSVSCVAVSRESVSFRTCPACWCRLLVVCVSLCTRPRLRQSVARRPPAPAPGRRGVAPQLEGSRPGVPLGVPTDPGICHHRLCFNWRPMWGLPLLRGLFCFRGLQAGGKSVCWFGGRFRGPVCLGAVLAAATGGSDVTEFAGWLRSHRGFGVLCWSGGCVGRWPEIELIDTRVGPIALCVCVRVPWLGG